MKSTFQYPSGYLMLWLLVLNQKTGIKFFWQVVYDEIAFLQIIIQFQTASVVCKAYMLSLNILLIT